MLLTQYQLIALACMTIILWQLVDRCGNLMLFCTPGNLHNYAPWHDLTSQWKARKKPVLEATKVTL